MEICHVCDEEYEPSEPEEVEEFPEKSVPRTFEAKWLHSHLMEEGYKLRVWRCPHCGGTAKATAEVDFKDLLGLSEGCPEMAEEKEHKARGRAWRIEHGVHADPSEFRTSRTGDTVIASKHLAKAIGEDPMLRQDAVAKFWWYVYDKKLHTQGNLKVLCADDVLKPVFGKKDYKLANVPMLFDKHLTVVDARDAFGKRHKDNQDIILLRDIRSDPKRLATVANLIRASGL